MPAVSFLSFRTKRIKKKKKQNVTVRLSLGVMNRILSRGMGEMNGNFI